MIYLSTPGILICITMVTAPVQPELIDHVAQEAQLTPEAVERVLQLTAENIEQATESHAEIHLTRGTGKTAVLLALMSALAAAEHEGTVDAPMLATLTAFRNLLAHGRAPDRIIDALMPESVMVPTPAAVLQARRNAQARSAFLEEFGALRSHEVADLAESRASNRAALANRWRTEGRVLAVPVRDQLLYPGFQFTAEGKPRSAIQPVVHWLRSDPHTTDWQTALWFASPSGWLGGGRPVDLLDEDADAVLDAARREVSDVVG
jgi:hypothetical protein